MINKNMTSKEKAQELVDKFQKQVSRNGHRIENVKQCALIAVNEILKSLEYFDEKVIKRNEEYRPLSEYAYWNKVKEEINKL